MPLVQLQITPLDEPEGVVDRLQLLCDSQALIVEVGWGQEALPIKHIIDNFTTKFTSSSGRNGRYAVPEILLDSNELTSQFMLSPEPNKEPYKVYFPYGEATRQ